MADWEKLWDKRKRRKQYHNTGVKAAIRGSGTNSAAFVKSVMKRRRKNKIAHESRRRNRG